MTFKAKLSKALNEKDVENIYRSELVKIEGSEIVSPYGVDGLLKAKNIRSLLEFKYNDTFKNKLSQCNVLIQCLYYLKKFEENGEKLPSTMFVGDINECFAIHTNSVIKYLSSEIDWKIAPSEAHRRNTDLVHAMVNDVDILPFVFDIDDRFEMKHVIEKIKEFSMNVIKKVRVTKHNIVSIFDYFDKNILTGVTLSTNEKANLFMQIVINSTENCLHPKKKNTLMTRSFGELSVNQNLFNSFFQHFEGELYSPKEKESLTALVDRLVEDTVRRSKGEFFTPTPFVDLAHKYIDETFGYDWKEKFVVWDCAAGTLNLTRDYQFNELYVSTLEKSDIDTANQMGYNMEAVKFQYDFLNDDDEKLPFGLKYAIESGKEVLFLINPPYQDGSELSTVEGESDIKGNIQTLMNKEMLENKWGKCSKQLFAQFLYRINKYQEINKNVKIAFICKPIYFSGESYKEFRNIFFNNFSYEKGFLFEALHFSDVANGWGISCSLFNNNKNKNSFLHDLVDYDDNFNLIKIGEKEFWNCDNEISLSNWMGKDTGETEEMIKLSSFVSVSKDNLTRKMLKDSLGMVVYQGNSVMKNVKTLCVLSTAFSHKGTFGLSITKNNFYKYSMFLTARKSIINNWINDKDEYLAPNEQHENYEQFTYDSIVYSLFNNSSQQSSLRQVDYKEKKWDIKNEFFWLSKTEMQTLANENSYDELYKDAKHGSERFVYTKLFKEGIYDKLSPDAKEVLDMATELVKKSIKMRKLLSENHPEYHLDTFDAGYAQLKLVWKEYFKEDFDAFRTAYKRMEDRLRPQVYELGFLRK